MDEGLLKDGNRFLAGLTKEALKGAQRAKYNEVMGSISNPQVDKIKHFYNDIVKPKFPYANNMTAEQLEGVIDKLTAEYNIYGIDADGKAATVAKSGEKYSKDPNRTIIRELQDVRAMMQAINDYRAEVIKVYDKVFAQEEKAAADAAAAAEKAKATATSPLGASAPTATMEGGTAASLPPSVAGVLQGDVKVGGAQVKKSYLLFGGLTLGVLGFPFLRKR